MRAIVLPEPWKAVTAEREIPVPKQGEALLKMVCGGICGSDLASASPHMSAIRVRSDMNSQPRLWKSARIRMGSKKECW